MGYSSADIDRLNVIHVAGTKGKGSTCALVEGLLRAHGQRTGTPRKTGLYSSPHLVSPEERIRINSKPLSKAKFAAYVTEVRECLFEESQEVLGPQYLQFLALTSFHVFIRENVDVAIYETYHRGEFCSTNIVQNPIVTATTPIDEDHIQDLGPSIKHIAWHKAGIFKAGSFALSVPQQPVVTDVLRDRATEKGATLEFVNSGNFPQIIPDVQRTNFSLAHAISNRFLQRQANLNLSLDDISKAMKGFYWPGRFHLVERESCKWFLDGAHNKLSVEKVAEWFASKSQSSYQRNTAYNKPPERLLVFSHPSNQRDGAVVLEHLGNCLRRNGLTISGVIFPGSKESYTNNDMSFGIDSRYFKVWKTIYPECKVQYTSAVERAMNFASKPQAHEKHILVTGSLLLVGSALRFLDIL